jgi:3-oxoacyl-(acyl-carrier-protein) synthase
MESLEHAQKRGATILAEYLGGGWQEAWIHCMRV